MYFDRPELLLLLALLYACLAVVANQGSKEAGSRSFAVGLAAIALWLLGSAVEVGAAEPGWIAFGMAVSYGGVVLVPVAFLVFTLHFTGRFVPTPGLLVGLTVVPLLTLLLVWTNSWHEWMWAHPPLIRGPEGAWRVQPDWGGWFRWVHVPYGYGLLLLGVGVLLRELTSPLYRAPVATFLVAMLLPLATNFLYLLGVAPRATHLALGVSGFVFAWGYFRHRLFRLTPVAYRSVFEALRDGVIVLDRESRVVEMNPVAASMALGSRTAALGRPLADLLPGDSPILALLRRGTEVEEVIEGRDGRMEEVIISTVRGARGEHRGRMVLLRDITARTAAERALRQNQELIRTLVDQSPSGILRLRAEGSDFRILLANPEAGRILGRDPEQLTGGLLVRDGGTALEPLATSLGTTSRGGGMAELELPFRGRWFRVEIAPVGQDLSVSFVDITHRKARERRMEKEARRDPLTGLLNRRGLELEARETFLPGGDSRRACALFFLDLDEFKPVNDTLGHEAGDELLRRLADRIRKRLRGHDMAARLGGDEFAILLPGVDRATAHSIATRLREELREPYSLDEGEVRCPASIGIALQPEDGHTLSALLRAADRAMYAAKREEPGLTFATDLPPLEGFEEPDALVSRRRFELPS